MPNPIQVAFLTQCRSAALAAATAYSAWDLNINANTWSGAAAAEAWCETSGVHFPPHSNNVLGIKATHTSWTGKTVTADGTEQMSDGSWTGKQSDLWCVFDSLQACYAQQLHILHNGLYAKALAATTVEDYITAECFVWSTAQAKGQCVLTTFHAHSDVLA